MMAQRPRARLAGAGFPAAFLVLVIASISRAPDAALAAGGKQRSAAYWDKLLADEDRLKGVEDEWASGDDDEELITEGQLEYQNMERRKSRPASPKGLWR